MLRLLTVALLLTCGFSEAAKVRIEGLRTIGEADALDLMGGRLEFIKSRPASPSRADDAAFLLEALLRKRGYNDPTVRAEVRSPQLIVLMVKEGPVSTLGKVTVRGVDPEFGNEIGNQFGSAHRGKVRRVMERAPYLRSATPQGVANATALLQSKGYWDGTVALASANPTGSGITNVTLDVAPGPLYRLAEPRVLSGGTTEAEISDRLAGLTGEVANTKNITLARNRVERIFRGSGYQDAEAEMSARHEDGKTYLTFKVTQGRQYSVGSFTVTGEEDTKKHRIENRFKGVAGTIYDADEVNDRIKKVFATGAFSGLRLDEMPHDDGTLDLTLHVTEGKPDGYYVYGGAGSYEGPIIGAGYYHRNLFGNLWNFTGGLEFSGLGLLGDARLTDPFFLETDLRFTARAFLTTRAYDGWGKIEGGFGAELDWELTRHYSLTFSFVNSFVSISSDGIPGAELGISDYLLTTIGLTQIYDRRDDPVLPTKGFYASLATDLGITAGEGSVGFVRAEGKVSGYFPIAERATLAAGFRGGVIVPSADQMELPIDLRYFNGGASTVRSFPERELGPVSSNGYPLGGEAFWVANLEYIHKVKGPLRAVAFVDAGSLSPDHFSLGEGDIELAAGLGIRLDLPIGPVRLEYGHSLSRDPGEPSGAFHFAIGMTF